jgi:tetratricopeptide (TPR) repeat protein
VATLFGRGAELELVERWLVTARDGETSFALLTGEAGIGKSSLGKAIAARARAEGMRVVSAGCWESGGAPAYWPWLQLFEQLAATPFEALERDDGGDAEQRRFQLFRSVTRVLVEHAAARPLLVFLDDLHAADLASLLLLLFVSRHAGSWPLSLLATARQAEARLAPEVAGALAKLARSAQVIALSRLTRADVAAWIQDAGSAQDAEQVFQITEGNPLFVHEILRSPSRPAHKLASDGISATLEAHASLLPEGTRALLEAAAVLGRDFSARDWALLTELDGSALLEHGRRACQADVLEDLEQGRYRFTHMLLRDHLYGGLRPRVRSELHWRAGMLAQASGAEPTRVADHLLLGVDSGDAQRAASVALEVAEQALRTLAFEAARALCERALAVLGLEPSALRCRLEIARAESLIRSGSPALGRARCVHAAELSQRLGYAQGQARAALVYGSEFMGVGVDPVMVRLLEEALVATGVAGTPVAAQLGARLALALVPPARPEVEERIGALAEAALATARHAGDPEALLYVLQFSGMALAYRASGERCLELARETMQLARQLDRRVVQLRVGPSYAVYLLERGQRAAAEAVLNELTALAAVVDYPQSLWRLHMLRAGCAFFDGRLAAAEQLGDEARQLAESAGTTAAREWGSQRVGLAIVRGDPAGIRSHAEQLSSLFPRGSLLAGFGAWVDAALGRRPEALAALREARAGLPGFPQLIAQAEACVLLADTEAAPSLYEALERQARGREFLWESPGAPFGPASRLLGELARLQGQAELAQRHWQEAAAVCRRAQAWPFLELCLAALGGRQPTASASAVPSNAPAPAVSPAVGGAEAAPSARPLLVREGDVWAVVGSAGQTFHLKHAKGLSYLHELISRAPQELHVFTLVGVDHATGDAGPTIDAQATAEYKERVSTLSAELDEAEAFGDLGRASRAREELEFLVAQLDSSLDGAGRARRVASDAQRARINVQRRLKDTIAAIAEQDPELGRQLSRALKTGTYCSYNPP